MAIEDKDKKKLFRQFRHVMGAPLRQIELTDEKITDFCCDRNTTSLPTATADTIITPTTFTIELWASKYILC